MAGDVDTSDLPEFDDAVVGMPAQVGDPLADSEAALDSGICECEEQLRKDEEVHTSAVLSLHSSLTFSSAG